MPLSTCDLSDKYGDHARIVPPLFRHFGGKTKFHGLAVTLRCPEDNSRLKELVDMPGAGRVLVVDGGASMRYALMGDMVAQRAVDQGWAGVVLHGCVRDTGALLRLSIGVMALGAVPRRSLKNGEGQVGLPVEIADVVCGPGDWVVADEDGLVFINSALLPADERR